MSVAKKPKDLVAFAIRAEEISVGPRCEASEPASHIYAMRCQRRDGHLGKHWAKEYSADGDGSITSEWADKTAP